MQLIRFLTLVFMILFVTGLPASADTGEEGIDKDVVKERMEKWINKQKGSNGKSGNMPELHSPLAPVDVVLNEKNTAIQQDAITEYFRHVTESNEHQRKVFRWQLLSSRVIFVMVIVLVMAGIYFAAKQFHNDLRDRKEGTMTTIKFGGEGIEVSSSVLGVIILIISLLFFYLYLVYIYPIEFVG